MSVGYNVENDVIGGMGGMGGLGGGGSFPLWLLIFLGLGKDKGGLFGGGGDGGGAAGFNAGQTQSKLDCLELQHQGLSDQIAGNALDQKFQVMGNSFSELAAIERSNSAAATQRDNDLSRQLAECCCENLVGQQKLETAIAMQTNVLGAQATANTQILSNLINDKDTERKNEEIARLNRQLQTAEITAVVHEENRHHRH